MKIMDKQIAQQTAMKPLGPFSAQGEDPKKEQIQAITLRSGAQVELPMPKAKARPTDGAKPSEAPKEVSEEEVNLSTVPFPQRLAKSRLDK